MRASRAVSWRSPTHPMHEPERGSTSRRHGSLSVAQLGLSYNAHGIDGLADRWNRGCPPTFMAEKQAEIVSLVLVGPDSETTSVSAYTHAYTQKDLAKLCEDRFDKRMHPEGLIV